MKPFFQIALAAFIFLMAESKTSPPKVQVYSSMPGEYGKENTMVCHVTQFHPPDIEITLLKDGKEMPNTVQSDLTFKDTWQFHLTKMAPFIPFEGEAYACKVTHLGKTNHYSWENNM